MADFPSLRPLSSFEGYSRGMSTADLRYPIGPFVAPAPVTPNVHEAAVSAIAGLPSALRAAVRDLNDTQIDTPYRPDGWTVRQVVHHVADSHMHGLLRVKLTLTEHTPTIKPYDEHATAMLADYRLPLDVSLALIDAVHARWIAMYKGMTGVDWSRAFLHPERGTTMTLAVHAQLYAWHSRHHVAHITELRRREGW